MKWGELNWIESAGGPLILLPSSDLSLWEGIRLPSAGRIVEARFRWNHQSDLATDYDRACDIDRLLGLIQVGNVEALVLGDEPLATAWLPYHGRPGGVVVRWRYAEEEQSVVSRQSEILMQDASEAEVALRVRSSPLLMFDSAVAGSDLEMVEALLIELQPGTYRVSSGEFNPVTLHDQAYNTDRHIATGNPYRKLVTDLMGRGVQVELCGATAKAHGWGNADLLPGMM